MFWIAGLQQLRDLRKDLFDEIRLHEHHKHCKYCKRVLTPRGIGTIFDTYEDYAVGDEYYDAGICSKCGEFKGKVVKRKKR